MYIEVLKIVQQRATKIISSMRNQNFNLRMTALHLPKLEKEFKVEALVYLLPSIRCSITRPVASSTRACITLLSRADPL